MNDKTKAVLHITAPDGQEFVEKGAIINQTTGLNGFCVEIYIPTKAIQNHVDTDSIQGLIAQAEIDKKAYPAVWFKGWQWSFGDSWISGDSPYYSVENNRHQNRRHPHADIIMQYEQDKIDYPDFWRKLTQCSTSIMEWHDQTNYEFNFDFDRRFKYRQHPHRESIIQFYQCSEADKKRWQILDPVWGWITPLTQIGFPNWHEDCQYRLRPKVCFITLQDGTRIEWDEPVRDALEVGQEYWTHNNAGNGVHKFQWFGNHIDKSWLKYGLLHLTEEAAKQHLSALQAMNAQVAV